LIMNSVVITSRAERVNGTLPSIADSDRIYDNGSAQMFHYVPETPYQP
jgi:hypothetical protein